MICDSKASYLERMAFISCFKRHGEVMFHTDKSSEITSDTHYYILPTDPLLSEYGGEVYFGQSKTFPLLILITPSAEGPVEGYAP